VRGDLKPLLVVSALIIADLPGSSRASEIGWPEAVSRLAGERSKAETCGGALKTYGNPQQVGQGQLAYGIAKADYDAIIAGLVTALTERESPKSLPSLDAALDRGALNLAKFCGSVGNLLTGDAGQKGVLVDLVKGAIEPAVQGLSEAVAAIYNNHRNDNALTRETIKTQLEAARWPNFVELKAAK
jgi:hypothetical protein